MAIDKLNAKFNSRSKALEEDKVSILDLLICF